MPDLHWKSIGGLGKGIAVVHLLGQMRHGLFQLRAPTYSTRWATHDSGQVLVGKSAFARADCAMVTPE